MCIKYSEVWINSSHRSNCNYQAVCWSCLAMLCAMGFGVNRLIHFDSIGRITIISNLRHKRAFSAMAHWFITEFWLFLILFWLFWFWLTFRLQWIRNQIERKWWPAFFSFGGMQMFWVKYIDVKCLVVCKWFRCILLLYLSLILLFTLSISLTLRMNIAVE